MTVVEDDSVFMVFEGGETYAEESSSELSLAQLRITNKLMHKNLLIGYGFKYCCKVYI